MNKYYFEEIDNIEDSAEFIELVFADTLMGAKFKASIRREKENSILKIYSDSKRKNLLSIKKKRIWKDK